MAQTFRRATAQRQPLLAPLADRTVVAEPEAPLPPISGFALSANGVYLGGSAIGSPATIREMLAFAAEKQIAPWIVKRPLSQVNEVIKDFATNGAR